MVKLRDNPLNSLEGGNFKAFRFGQEDYDVEKPSEFKDKILKGLESFNPEEDIELIENKNIIVVMSGETVFCYRYTKANKSRAVPECFLYDDGTSMWIQDAFDEYE